MINVKDINGNWVVLDDNVFYEEMAKGGTLYGVDLAAIRAFIQIYDENRGKYPITSESIKELLQ